MAPFTVPVVGTTKSPVVPLGTPDAGALNCVGPLYAGSELLHPGPVGLVLQFVPVNGCVMVLVGHCTRNDCALAVTVTSATKRIGIQTWNDFLMTVQPPSTYLDLAKQQRANTSVATPLFPR
ncbi:MAG: hypothetical protein C5B58_09900 [Acidobacteria bacterium]|nr:MAG: hypothetical protein C5B58_09900 [Acidobacteriota bacterium]